MIIEGFTTPYEVSTAIIHISLREVQRLTAIIRKGLGLVSHFFESIAKAIAVSRIKLEIWRLGVRSCFQTSKCLT